MSIKKLNNEFETINNESIYHPEIAKKDKQILTLKYKINKLILNKNSLISQINNSKQKNIKSQKKKISPKNNLAIHNKLIPSIRILDNENCNLKKKMDVDNKIKDKYNDTIKYKLLSAQKEIDNLTIMNANKDKIIMNMQKFINNLNNLVCNGKINLNLEKIDIKTFIKNLNQLEQKIISNLFKKNKSQSNKIPEGIIKDAKQNSIMKQNTEISFAKKKNLYIIPLINMKHIKKINSNISINKSIKYSNNSLNSIYQNNSNNKINNWKEMRCLTGKNKEKSMKFRQYFLNKQNFDNSNSPIKEKKKSLKTDEYFRITNNEIQMKNLLTINWNDSLFKKSKYK
jgi:hypothetical protein